MELLTKSSFSGGVHPIEGKDLSKNCEIKPAPMPQQVAIMLSQHIGAPCEPIVAKKDEVTVGEKIGDAEAFVSAPVHSPVNGTVKDIALQSHAILGRSIAIIIDVDPEDNAQKQSVADKFDENFDVELYSAKQIAKAVRDSGIVGMGGAGFPTSVKIIPDPPKENLIINGCECEPFITCDYRIMLEWTYQIIAGIKLIKRAAWAKRIFIAIEDNKPAAIEAFALALAKCKDAENIAIAPVKTKYPQGGERQLIKAVLDKYVPTSSIPPMIGVVVANVATAAAVAEAVVMDAPLTHRVVTVSGGGIAKPANLLTAIGTPVKDLIDHCGGLNPDAMKIILGGPMMGIAISDLTKPITKASGAITVLTAKEIGHAKSADRQTACIRCGRCLQVCPEHINPTKIAHAVKANMLETARQYYITACIECGCCGYVCPANIELAGYIKTGKILLAKEKKRNSK